MEKPVPVIMGLDGAVVDTAKKVDYLLACYVTSAFDQNYIEEEGKTTNSLANDLYLGGGNINSVVGYIQSSLQELFGKSFIQANILVQEDPSTVDLRHAKINIDISVYDGQYQDKSIRILEIEEGRFNRISKINNG